jgi:UDP-N-acetyl-2-amino-2-deoxyglucuronate dehydrogenase
VLEHNKAAGFLQLKKARIRWFLSIDFMDVPANIRSNGKRTYRSLKMDGEEIEFSDGFTDLHTRTYEEIIAGSGYGLEAARQSIETVYEIRNAKPLGLQGDYHPMAAQLKL